VTVTQQRASLLSASSCSRCILESARRRHQQRPPPIRTKTPRSTGLACRRARSKLRCKLARCSAARDVLATLRVDAMRATKQHRPRRPPLQTGRSLQLRLTRRSACPSSAWPPQRCAPNTCSWPACVSHAHPGLNAGCERPRFDERGDLRGAGDDTAQGAVLQLRRLQAC
jgi:hypothetical protein